MSNSDLRFFVLDANSVVPNDRRPYVALHKDNWDDYGFKTSYFAVLHDSDDQDHELGQVKILQTGQESGRTAIPQSFAELDASFASLGQDIRYYETLIKNVSTELRTQYLSSTRDIAASKEIRARFESEPGLETSLLRFGQALNALKSGAALLDGHRHPTGRMSFTFEWNRGNGTAQIPMKFDDTGELPGRCHVLIGYNGVGKTTLLADLAIAASRGRVNNTTDSESVISGEDTTFGAVIAISYSAFDTFKTPTIDPESYIMAGYENASEIDEAESKTGSFGYVYCGLRTIDNKYSESDNKVDFRLKSIDQIEREFVSALHDAGNSGQRERELLKDAFKELSGDPSFGRAGIDLAKFGEGLDTRGIRKIFRYLSTGHKIVLNIVAQLAAHLRTRSLVLIDEPETHLHPPLMAALLRAIQGLLKGHESFAVLATHSPVVVQEVQARYVRVLERYGSEIQIRPTQIETFGSNIGTITRHVFSLDSSSSDYQGVLESLARRLTLEEIDRLFEQGLSPQARALVLNYQVPR